MSLYELLIKDKGGNTLASLDSASNRSYELYLNKPGQAAFSLSIDDPKITPDLISLGYTELYVLRGGSPVWGGEIQLRTTRLGNTSANLTAKGWGALLDKRLLGDKNTPLTFTATDASQIAAAIVTANADLGFTVGYTPVATPQDHSYQYKNAKEAIEDVSNLKVPNSLDFEFTPEKRFNTYAPQKGSTLDHIVFEYGVNIVDFSLTEDATDMVNQIIAQGAGQGSAMLTAQSDSSAYVQNSYKLRQDAPAFKDVEEPTTLQKYANQALIARQSPTLIASVTIDGSIAPAFGTYSLGDTVRVRIRRGWVVVDGYYRIYGIKVNIGEEDEEQVELIFNHN
jgi:hypothetical protein